MNPGTTGVSASNPTVPVRRRGPRGVQLEEVVEAADALLGQGLKPTIERVRQQLGGGSPKDESAAPVGRVAAGTYERSHHAGPVWRRRRRRDRR